VIPAGSRQLRRAFFTHSKQAKKGTSSSHYLLLFYAVECGLKSIYIERAPTRIRTIRDLSDERLRRSHDLARWALELRLPSVITRANTSFRLRRDKSSWSIEYAHEAWRYGIAMHSADEQRLVRWLNEVYKWIEEKI
jgi:hypothetical protein